MKILALDVGGTAIKSALVAEDGSLVDQRTSPSDKTSPQILAQHAIAVAKSYTDYDVLAVAMTGQLDHNTQTILAWSNGTASVRVDFPVGKYLSEALNCPVFVLNDANAAALGEAYYGAGRGYTDFLCLTYGTGVGGGIIQNGQLTTGRKGIAGEFGHVAIRGSGHRCRCGRRGCYQEYASTTALLREARKLYPALKDARELFEMLPNTPDLLPIRDKWIDHIVDGLCSLACAFDPQCFVLGGGVMERTEILELVRKQYAKRAMPTFADIELLTAQLGNSAGLIGAAAYARTNLYPKNRKEQ